MNIGIVQHKQSGELFAVRFSNASSDGRIVEAAGPITERIFDEQRNRIDGWQEIVTGWLSNHSDTATANGAWLDGEPLYLIAEAQI